jgi:signal transduction histidine kinase
MNLSLKARWVLSFFLLIAVTLGIEAFFLTQWVKNELKNQLYAKLETQGSLLASLVEQSLNTTGNLKTAAQLALTSTFDPQIQIQVANLNGHIIFDSKAVGPPSGMINPEAINAQGESQWENTNSIYVSKPIHQAGETVGFIVCTASKSTFFPMLKAFEHALLGTLGGAFVVSIFLAFFVSQNLIKPLLELEKVTQEIAKGDWEKKVQFKRSDEIGRLANSIHLMEEALKEQFSQIEEEKNTLQALFSSMIDGLIVLDENRNIKFLNPAAEKALRVRSQDAFSKPLDSLWPLEEIKNLIKESFALKKTLSKEVNLPYNVLKVFVIPIFSSNAAGMLLFRDITEVRELEKTRNAFLGQVSHELRTPLTIIKGYVVTLLDDPHLFAFPEIKKILSRTEVEVDRLNQMVEELLEFSRLKAGRGTLAFAPLSIQDLASDVVENFRPHANRYHINLQFECAGEIPQILGDANRLKQVLLNLLDNAVKYTPAGGKVKVSLWNESQSVILAVSDTGSGIPQADLPHIFERFFQGKKGGKGWGLGLPIVKEIVEAHGADIKIESQEGHGTCVKIVFKLK